MFDRIERLKADWTDKYVVIASSAPELARFSTATGLVKTVNMNGRCLVEFDQYNNVGWYDIDPAALKVVPKPLPKPAEAKAAKPAPAAKPAAAKPAAAKPAAGASAKKPSTADILAAARAKAGGAPAAKPAATGGKPSTAEILARARGAKAAAAPAAEPAAEPEAVEEQPPVPPAPKATAKPAAGKAPTTTAEKIAWCRANDAKG